MEIFNKNELDNNIEILKEDLKKYYVDERKSIAEISRIYKCDRRIIKRRLKKYEISIIPYKTFLKKDLERYYIDEKKSINEISSIYECSWYIIERELEKYKIPIRRYIIFLKEDIERYYINEGLSMAEISRIYDCDRRTIESRLKKYRIPIRPQGAFIVDNDGKSLYSKCCKGEISEGEYLNEVSKNKGYMNYSDYLNTLSKKRGYIDRNEYDREMHYKRGDCLPMSENKDCSKYLGVYIAERLLPLLFENVEKMPENNPGFDFICNHGYKVDVKSSSLHDNNRWHFHINNNKVADYFFIAAFDDRENLNIMHIWLVKGDAIIEKTNHYLSKEFIFNEKDDILIGNNKQSLKRWIKYEKIDLLEKSQKICNDFKNNKCKINVSGLNER